MTQEKRQISSLPCRCRDDIETEIAMKWLQGIGRSPCTWDTLVSVLEDIGLKGLASKIVGNLHRVYTRPQILLGKFSQELERQ